MSKNTFYLPTSFKAGENEINVKKSGPLKLFINWDGAKGQKVTKTPN